MNETSKSKRGWRIMRRLLIGVAILATLIAIFYTEEDWRGKRAWENCKRELEAKGMVLDWNKYIPPPVPDDQNFFTANSNILLRFKKTQTEAEYAAATNCMWLRIQYSTNSFPVLETAKTGPLVVANLSVLPPGAASRKLGTNSLVVTLHDPAAPQRVRDFIQTTVGQSMHGSAGFQFSAFQLANLQPARIVVQAETPPSISDFENLIPPDTATNIGLLHVEAASGDQNTFHVLLTGVRITAAADFLKWSDQFEPAFDEIREALKRPYAILPGDYSEPYLMPMVNFITIRSVAQTLAQRAQCYFLLGEPDKALGEVTLIHDLCRILEKPTMGKPITLVDAMINVAITGLYVNTIADGMRSHAWQEPQIAALQAQLVEINLSPWVAKAFNQEIAVSCFRWANTPEANYEIRRVVSKSYDILIPPKLADPEYLFLAFAPRGWVYQDMVNSAMLQQKPLSGFDMANNTVSPRLLDDADRDTRNFVHRITPYRFLADITIPNYVKAEQTAAVNQTLANEAQIACALERYHLAHGEYPETLGALVPQFIEKLPHDIIGGQPLHYHRTSDGKFLLYSVGWNETDDGGVPGHDFAQGDWVWQN